MDFVSDSFKELDDIEKQQLDANENVKKLIVGTGEFGVIPYAGTDIRYRKVLSKSLRHKVAKNKLIMGDLSDDEESVSKIEKMMYEVLSELCVDSPFNDWKTWAYIDEMAKDSGVVLQIFTILMQKIGEASEDDKDFRRVKRWDAPSDNLRAAVDASKQST